MGIWSGKPQQVRGEESGVKCLLLGRSDHYLSSATVISTAEGIGEGGEGSLSEEGMVTEGGGHG